MGCLSDDDVLAFVGRKLSGPALAAAEEHVAGCADCRRRLAGGLCSSARDAAGAAPSPTAGRGTSLVGQGRRVMRFQVVEVICVGASGVVYRAHDPQLAREVALKLLRPDITEPALAESWRKRFLF